MNSLLKRIYSFISNQSSWSTGTISDLDKFHWAPITYVVAKMGDGSIANDHLNYLGSFHGTIQRYKWYNMEVGFSICARNVTSVNW